MKNIFQILLLFAFLVLPTNQIFACGNSKIKARSEKTSCEKHDGKRSCCKKEKKNHDQHNDCDGSCNNSSCQSQASSNIVVVLPSFEFQMNIMFFEIKDQWIFDQHSPQQLSLSIWQPPKIG